MIIGLQVIALLFVLIMLYFPYLHYRRGEINRLEISLWFIVWLGAILIIIFPSVINTFSKAIAISRALDLAIMGGFILVIPMVYLTYIKSRRLEKKLEELIRSESLKEIKTNGKRK